MHIVLCLFSLPVSEKSPGVCVSMTKLLLLYNTSLQEPCYNFKKGQLNCVYFKTNLNNFKQLTLEICFIVSRDRMLEGFPLLKLS